MPEPHGIETAGSFGVGNSYIIVSVGTTDFTLIGAVDNRVGVVFEATGAGSGNGTARRLNSQLGRIGGKLLADNLLRDGIDLAVKNTAYDTPVLYLKVDPEVRDTVAAGSFVTGIRYRIRTLGTTNFLLIGSLSNTVGTLFTATGPGTGTGTADRASDVIGDTDGADDQDPTSNQGAGSAVGFATDTPAYDLDINNDAKTTNVEATSQANISNIIINAAGYISTTVGPLYISPAGHDPIITFDRMTTDDLYFSDNTIGSFSNSNIEFNPSGTGTVELESTTNITGDFNVTGSVTIDGNLTTPSSISFGDSTFTAPSTGDTLDFNTFISQDLNPGIDNEFNLGMPNNKWGDLWAPDWTNISNLRPSRIRVSDQQILDGVAMEIRSLQSNDDLVLNPATGVLYVEELKFGNAPPTLITIDNPNPDGLPNNDRFGHSVDTSASYFIVGAFGENVSTGAAYIYSATTGTLITTLSNPNAYGASTLDIFGYDVAISESYAVVSAPNEDEATATNSGRVYVFSTADWSLLHTLTNPNTYGTPDNENFGYNIEVSESYVIVGADAEDDVSGSYVGRAYIYDAATGTLLHTLNNPTGNPNDFFGSSVAITETYAAVGAPNYSIGNQTGRVYIFNTSDGSLRNTIDNPTSTATEQFGYSVDMTDSYTIVGSPNTPSSGVAYIFDTATGSLAFTLSNPNAFSATILDRFGESVGITNSYAIVGAAREDDVGHPTIRDTGKAYIFSTADGSLLHTIDNPNPDGVSTFFNPDAFGNDVAINEVSAAIGTSAEDQGGTNTGKAYFFLPLSGADEARITNLNTSTPVQFASTGAGYLRFMGTNAVLIPAGDDTTRPSSPELGDTRWNTDEQYLECFDGSVYVIATGGGEEVTQELMTELGNVYSLILG